MQIRTFVVVAAMAAMPGVALAQHGNKHKAEPPESAMVDFGVLPLQPIGGTPCLQAGGIGGPADPCAYQLHHLTPEEVDIARNGEVTFQIHGGGHGLAIYQVGKDTTREDIGQFLCVGPDPSTTDNPADHPCNLSPANANAPHVIAVGKKDVLVVPQGEATHPNNRVWVVDGRLMSSGAIQFLNGGTVPAGPTSNGQLITYRFPDKGRYLVICMNRVHFLNDWMFGFVNVE